jgi:hypothetical protein
MAQLWPLYKWLDQIERQKAPGYTAAIAEAEGASERAAALALKRDVVLGARSSPIWRPLGLFFGT